MTSVSTYYTDFMALENFIQNTALEDSPSLLIQIFTAQNDLDFIETLLENVRHLLPQAVIIGSTTDGEIESGKVSTGKTVLSFTSFSDTKLKTYIVEHLEDGYYSGKSVAEELIEEDTKLILAFTDGLKTNGEAFLKGISSVNETVLVAGGLAGDNATFTQTYVFDKKTITSQGAVAVAFNSQILTVSNDYSFHWRRIGKELTITKVENNRVYTIDNRTAVETYMHYLGNEMAEGLPAVGIEFPLISVKNGMNVARAVLGKHEDGSLSFAGNFEEGDKVKFGYGNPKEILQHSPHMVKKVASTSPEAIFVYSCMARRHFMSDVIEAETLPLHDLAPVAGFFTYGEFFTSEKKELLNQSMTILSLRENVGDLICSLPKIEKQKALSGASSSTHALIHLLDVTSSEAMEQRVLNQAQSLFETLYQSSADGIVLIEDNRFMHCNQKLLDIFGYDSEESFLQAKLQALSPRVVVDGSPSAVTISEMKTLSETKGKQQFEWMFNKEDGTRTWLDIMVTSITLKGREILYVVCKDNSERKEMEIEFSRQKSALYFRANHDALTGLPNRTFFMNELRRTLLEAVEKEEELVLMFIDLDRFKKINDSLGHSIGDVVIKTIGERLLSLAGTEHMVARLGGDEFLFLMKDVKNNAEIFTLSEQILLALKEAVVVEHYTLYTTASIGISRYPLHDTEAENLLKYADTAMYKAKEEGGNSYYFYNKEMTELALAYVMMEKDLREGIKNGDFEVYYQPQVNAKTRKVTGLEALVRWQHPVAGILTPKHFIPLLEKTGLIVELDLWVMEQAMKDVSNWYKKGFSPGVLALNISMKQLEYPYLQEVVKAHMKTYDFQSSWLEFEITETEMMRDPEKVIGILNKLHTLGIILAIDDFGTGYSSLSHLKRLPIDKLKIDQSFIADIPEDSTAKTIVKTMIVLAESLHLEVIAEGVENEAQHQFLVDNGCTQIQGHYYSEALPASAIENMLKHSDTRPVVYS